MMIEIYGGSLITSCKGDYTSNVFIQGGEIQAQTIEANKIYAYDNIKVGSYEVSLSNHNHDSSYAAKSHSHDSYSLTTHNHDSSYSKLNHNLNTHTFTLTPGDNAITGSTCSNGNPLYLVSKKHY